MWQANEVAYDAVVLDLMLPGIDGFEVCRRMRAKGLWAPVIMLTARFDLSDRIRGLDCGADDYLPKPFSFDELLARLRALIRRGSAARPAVLSAGGLRLDPATRILEHVWDFAYDGLSNIVDQYIAATLAAGQFLPVAFERFTRADDARAHPSGDGSDRGGNGLGLAIVRSVMTAHGGTATAANVPGGGAQVTLRFPASAPEQ